MSEKKDTQNTTPEAKPTTVLTPAPQTPETPPAKKKETRPPGRPKGSGSKKREVTEDNVDREEAKTAPKAPSGRGVKRTKSKMLLEIPENLTPEEKQAYERPRTTEESRLALRRLTRGFYDLQRLRLQCSGRVVKKTGAAPPVELHPADAMLLARQSFSLENLEKEALKDIVAFLGVTSPFYNKVLVDKKRYKGIGPTLAAVILSEFNVEKADAPSKFWAFAGLSVVPGRRCKQCSSLLEIVDIGKAPEFLYRHKETIYTKKCPNHLNHPKGMAEGFTFASGSAPRPTRGETLKYNAFLRSKMCGVMADTMLRVSSPWAKFYYAYKQRKETANWGTSPAHRDRAAKRYMIKMILLQIWQDWRQFVGLPIRATYHEEKQGGHGYVPGARPASPFEELDTLPPLPVKKSKTLPENATPAEIQAAEDAEDLSAEADVTVERMSREPEEGDEE